MKILTRDDTVHDVEYVTLADAEREIEAWKASHDNQVEIKRIIAARPDLAECAPMVEKLTDGGLLESTCSSFASIRRKQYPEYYMGWVPEYDAPKWTSYALDAAPVPLEILMDELNKVAAREVNVWAVIYPENAKHPESKPNDHE